MDECTSASEASDNTEAISVATRFLTALFENQDLVLFRPIETWVENGRKKSRVDYRNTAYRKAVPALVRVTILQLLDVAAKEHLNLFFGVCPRLGNKGRFDLAWQVRTVRAIWIDIDHVNVEEARARIAHAGLPEPSIIVASGNGIHAYWLLNTPYVIDDAGDPPPVEIEWTKTPDARKKSRKYYVEDGEKIYLDQRRHVSRLSPKAERVQDILAGVAKACGGDHTACGLP